MAQGAVSVVYDSLNIEGLKNLTVNSTKPIPVNILAGNLNIGQASQIENVTFNNTGSTEAFTLWSKAVARITSTKSVKFNSPGGTGLRLYYHWSAGQGNPAVYINSPTVTISGNHGVIGDYSSHPWSTTPSILDITADDVTITAQGGFGLRLREGVVEKGDGKTPGESRYTIHANNSININASSHAILADSTVSSPATEGGRVELTAPDIQVVSMGSGMAINTDSGRNISLNAIGTQEKTAHVLLKSSSGDVAAQANSRATITVQSTGDIAVGGNIVAGKSGEGADYGATININGHIDDTGNFIAGDAKVTIQGDIKTVNSETANKNRVNLNLASGGSSLTGSIKDSNLNVAGGTNLIMANGATWNSTGESTVKSVTADNANINLGENSATINDYQSKNGGANITMSGTKADQLVLNSSAGTGTTTIQTNDTAAKQVVLKNNTADIRMNLSQTASDKVGDNLQTVANMVDQTENKGEGAKGVTATLAEGDVAGARTVDINADDKITSVTEQKNDVMESLKDIGINSFLTFRSQMNDLDKRMGDLRTMPNSDGAWARVIAGQAEYKGVHNTYQTLQIGADHRIGNFVLGGTVSYSDGDGTLKNGSTDDKNYSFGLYGGWLGDDGQFVDITLKRHHTESDYDLRYTNGTKSKGSLDTSGTSISAEYGWRLGIEGTNYYVEPQVEFTYGHLDSTSYKTSRGVKVNQDAVKSAVGRVGVAAGWVSPDKAGSVYVKASVLNDWEGDADFKASKNGVSRKYHEDMGGTWGEFAVGGTYNLNKSFAVYGEAETTAGNPVRTTYQFSAGLRYSF